MANLGIRFVNLAWRIMGRKLPNQVAEAAHEIDIDAKAGAEAEAEATAGNQARDRRAWIEASVHYRQALFLRPGWTEIRVQLGNMLKEAGQPAEAEAAYRLAIDEMPDSADSHLQLGHALKLQSRHAEAREAYLIAARCDPYLESAQIELRSLGMSQRVIDQHIAAVTRRNAEQVEKYEAAHKGIDRTISPALSGWISEIGRDYVAGELHGIDRDSLPLIVVCQADDGTMATCVIEAAQASIAGGGRPGQPAPPSTVSYRSVRDAAWHLAPVSNHHRSKGYRTGGQSVCIAPAPRSGACGTLDPSGRSQCPQPAPDRSGRTDRTAFVCSDDGGGDRSGGKPAALPKGDFRAGAGRRKPA